MIPMNYAKLRGRIRECGFSQKTLAAAIHVSPSQFSFKLNNRYEFTTSEIRALVEQLDIPSAEIGQYFFTPKVQISKRKESNEINPC